jgi:hypothetical protein
MDATKPAVIICEPGAITEPIPAWWGVIEVPAAQVEALQAILAAVYCKGYNKSTIDHMKKKK